MEKTRSRYRRTTRSIHNLVVGLGISLIAAPSPASARNNTTPSPRRAVATPPWLEPGGVYPPPSPSGSTSAGEGRAAHPAIHGKPSRSVTALFPRHPDRRTENERAERQTSMARHPAGKGTPVARVEVRPGDSLWDIAADRVGPERVDECWPVIYTANREVIGTDPNHIEPGQRLDLPKTCR